MERELDTAAEKIRIMLVDDSAVFLRTAVRFLESQFEDKIAVVGTAGGGEEAVRVSANAKPQLVLLDLNMPGLSGLETIPRLRRILPDVRIIILTFMNGDGHQRESAAAGANGYVTKSRLDIDLWPTIQRVMGSAPAT